jgi:hypothetical protein
MTCERGKVLMVATLAPTMPPKVQSLRVVPAPTESTRSDADACR